jgi:tetratricopeptide (TPR) repeat protein
MSSEFALRGGLLLFGETKGPQMTATRLATMFFFMYATASPMMGQLQDWRAAMDRARSAQKEHRMDAALEQYEAALRAASGDPKLVGPKGVTLSQRGTLLHDLERSREAERDYLEALSIFRSHPDIALLNEHIVALNLSLASLYLEMDQPSKAVKLRLEDLLETRLSTANKARVHGVLAGVAYAQRRYVDAEAGWLKEVAINESENNPLDTAVALSNLGVLHATVGDFQKSERRLRRAVELFESSPGLEHPKSVRAQSNLGQVLFRNGRRDEGLAWLARAYERGMKWFGAENIVTAQLCLDYAEALRRTGRKDEAKALEAGLKRLPGATVSALRARSTVDVMMLK